MNAASTARCACGSSGAAVCGAGRVMALERGRGEGARGLLTSMKAAGRVGRVPIGVEKRNGAFFRKVDHHLRAVLQDGLRRNAPWESIPASRGSRVTRAASTLGELIHAAVRERHRGGGGGGAGGHARRGPLRAPRQPARLSQRDEDADAERADRGDGAHAAAGHRDDGAPAGQEWRSTLVPRYQRRLAEVNTAVLATYLAGGNTRRIRGALAPLLHGAPLSRSAVSRIVATLKSSLDAWQTRPLGDLEVVYAYLDALALRVRSGGKVVQRPGLGRRGRPRRRAEGAGGVGPVWGRIVRGVEGLPGRPRRAGAEGAAALHHRRPRRLAARRRRGLGAGGGPALLRPQAAQPGAQGPQARPRRAPRRLPPDRLRRECGDGPHGLDRLRADVGEAVSRRGQEPPGRAARSC